MLSRVLAAALAAGAASLCGCATIIQGTTQPVSITTTPEEGAQCTLTNSEGTWYLASPGSAVVHKTKNDLSIDCTKPGFATGHVVATSHFGGTTAGNVLLGGVVGLGVDAASGANYYYDNPISVPLGAPVAAIPAPPNPVPVMAPAPVGKPSS